ncbi:3-methyl-2-oxobutanoate hydroxymethyltransferase [Adlercreutzia sp. ZJ154]|uniref:3-methyl-2-oxobutanoate hydroxymethyltransferase n=1 Tax=Adlercreutzia sp. ZJ154 TaxID=2709790 RepID=UPI0013EDE644|nr:3-methyl-2-oxobutanoate hydroxymethyltransferase [Adlercreutzia sp. ZJ154]
MAVTVSTFQEMKRAGKKISMLTAYDYTTAHLVDEAGVDSILVGDSLGNVMLGLGDTIPVTMDDMVRHTAAVTRGAKNALVIADMPFMSYETSAYDAVVNAGRLVKEGRANAVKLEGGTGMADRIQAIVRAKIPVCAHIGLTPQGINAVGGFKVQGKTTSGVKKLLEDAHAVQNAGAFAVVIEAVPAEVAALITRQLSIPTIGIGAGAQCSGQVLVNQDMLGMFDDFTPKFVRRFAEVGALMKQAYREYDECVKSGEFPTKEHCYATPAGVLDELGEL